MLSLVKAQRRPRHLVSPDRFGGFIPSSGYSNETPPPPISIFKAAVSNHPYRVLMNNLRIALPLWVRAVLLAGVLCLIAGAA